MTSVALVIAILISSASARVVPPLWTAQSDGGSGLGPGGTATRRENLSRSLPTEFRWRYADPNSWARLQPLYEKKPDNLKGWLDFWVVCDEVRAYLFFTSLDGKMWRAETLLCDFPEGWSKPAVALEADVFEAGHTYHLAGIDKFLTVIEAQHGHGWRYYKAYLADRLDGPWQPLAGTRDKAFASMRNVTPTGARWTDVISHGELLRAGYNERLRVDPENLRLLFQGVLDKDRRGKSYGQIPWRLGLLQPVGDNDGR